tara:strand:+ start:129 stop:524 length:396 start_codon:yes stop_codon:yes gene_type:complete
MQANIQKLDKIGEEKLFDQLAAGSTTTALVASVGIGKRSFYSWLRHEDGRMERYYAARKQWADYLAEETLSIADSAVDASDAQVAKLRIDTRKWLAGQANPDNWAARREALVNINIQDQHLKALRDIVSEQ